ncbi:hypothetical protein HMPREF2955_11205 [Prevotella sp. HMSC073D09]|nr:hypothetical protein HMPREF2955_11205 [Prevotella sp. HMSC073D09]
MQKGGACECGKMNIYFKRPPFACFWRPFATKCSVFWCQMLCVLMLNAVHFGAKCKEISIKIHRNSINKTFQNHQKHGQKGQNDR